VIGGFKPTAVVVEGVYTEADVRRKRVGEPIFAGHVVLVTDDGRHLPLNPIWHPEARRSAEERARFAGQRVTISATHHPRAPQPPNGGAAPISPCLSAITSIELVEQES